MNRREEPTIAFLGPRSSYTHQVRQLIFMQMPCAVGRVRTPELAWVMFWNSADSEFRPSTGRTEMLRRLRV